MTEPDTTTMTGAEFQRHAGTDPQKWAEAFWQAFDRDGDRADHAGTVVLLAKWFADFAEVRIAEEVMPLARLVRDETEQAMRAPRHEP